MKGIEETGIEGLAKCKCGGKAVVKYGALFGSYVECLNCKKYTIIRGMESKTVEAWNYGLAD